MKYIDFIEDDEKGFVIEAHGFSGGACRVATEPYEELFTVKERVMKDEASPVKTTAKPQVKAR